VPIFTTRTVKCYSVALNFCYLVPHLHNWQWLWCNSMARIFLVMP